MLGEGDVTEILIEEGKGVKEIMTEENPGMIEEDRITEGQGIESQIEVDTRGKNPIMVQIDLDIGAQIEEKGDLNLMVDLEERMGWEGEKIEVKKMISQLQEGEGRWKDRLPKKNKDQMKKKMLHPRYDFPIRPTNYIRRSYRWKNQFLLESEFPTAILRTWLIAFPGPNWLKIVKSSVWKPMTAAAPGNLF